MAKKLDTSFMTGFDTGFLGDKAKEPVAEATNDIEIEIDALIPNRAHKFKSREAEIETLADSIKELGILSPIIVKKLEDGKYEIISGHNRRLAAIKAGLKTVPCKIVEPVDEYQERRMMGDANINREYLYPTEKGWIYRYQIEDLKHQGKRNDLSDSFESTSQSLDIVANQSDDSKSQIQRFVRLTYLDPDLGNLVDEEKLSLIAGVSLSYLTAAEQVDVYDVISSNEVNISTKQAELIKNASGKGLTPEKILAILNDSYKPRKPKTTKPKFEEKVFAEMVPEPVRHLPLGKRISYHKKALEYFEKYIEENPDILNEL